MKAKMDTFASQIKNKKVAVAFASGFFGFYHHAGMLSAMIECGIRPTRVTGTSAGAIVAGMYAAGLEPDDICRQLLRVSRKDFWDMQFPFTRTGFGLLAGNRFGRILAELLPVHRFEDCPIPVAFGVYDLSDGRSRYMTEGSLIDGIRASCAFPYLFSPYRVGTTNYWDGGFAEKTPLAPLAGDPDIDVVVAAYMTPRESKKAKKSGMFSSVKFFADTPPEERQERDRAAVKALRDEGKEVLVIAPDRVWLGPFSLDKAQEAMDTGKKGALQILNSSDPNLLGRPELK